MFAIVKNGGKQYRVKVGSVIELERINQEVGSNYSFDEVILASDNNSVITEGCKVSGSIISHKKDKKVIVFKKQRRTSSFTKKQGHRQFITSVLIKDIVC